MTKLKVRGPLVTMGEVRLATSGGKNKFLSSRKGQEKKRGGKGERGRRDCISLCSQEEGIQKLTAYRSGPVRAIWRWVTEKENAGKGYSAICTGADFPFGS